LLDPEGDGGLEDEELSTDVGYKEFLPSGVKRTASVNDKQPITDLKNGTFNLRIVLVGFVGTFPSGGGNFKLEEGVITTENNNE
jgi:hypothetical protein